ncbi:ECF RNA polymerase sigma factor SigH [Stieleria maiorica]|uniref:ECF RNA polymerase sigma factor SigH n=1 Tax=Stieleria maiorica TaxID=2795974 RepID=A0A5B9MN58_9BACT|nr:sigma factor [Stieleria maiorica]QEG01357.1 ECF RNA polymerase sigma factor SigH [Stieleria maiorica]
MPEPERCDESAEAIIARHRSGDPEAFGLLVRVFGNRLRTHLHAQCNHPSVDLDAVIQETWLKVSNGLGNYHNGSFIAWLFTIGRNTLADARTKRRPVSVGHDFPFSDYLIDERPRHSDAKALEALAECLDAADGTFVDVLRAMLAGHSLQDLAQQYDVSVNTVYTRAHRGRLQLRDCIERRI